MAIKNNVSFSTTISKETKDLIERFCKSKGMRINHLVDKALLEFIEDEMDKDLIDAREFEELVKWKKNA